MLFALLRNFTIAEIVTEAQRGHERWFRVECQPVVQLFIPILVSIELNSD